MVSLVPGKSGERANVASVHCLHFTIMPLNVNTVTTQAGLLSLLPLNLSEGSEPRGVLSVVLTHVRNHLNDTDSLQ